MVDAPEGLEHPVPLVKTLHEDHGAGRFGGFPHRLEFAREETTDRHRQPTFVWYSWETGLDITEQQAAAEALKERDLRQKAILDNIPDVAWLKDRKLRLVAVNRRFCTLM